MRSIRPPTLTAVVALLATGCSNSSSNSTSSGGTTGTAATSCNGLELQDSSVPPVTFYEATFPEADDIRTLCNTQWSALKANDGGTQGPLAGIFDVSPYGNPGPVYAVLPEWCPDIGVVFFDAGPPPRDAGLPPVELDGGSTVAAANAGAADVAVLYGLVTWRDAPYLSKGTAYSGSIYLQNPPLRDGGLAPNSGVAVYFPATSVTDGGGGPGSYPPSGVAIGNVVVLTNLSWSPYPKGAANPQNQLTYGASSTLSVLGQADIPPPVPLDAASLAGDGGVPQVLGMRVLQSGCGAGPCDTIVNACPATLQSP